MKKIYIYQEDKTILYEYKPNTRASKFTKQKLTELGWKIDKSKIWFRDFKSQFL